MLHHVVDWERAVSEVARVLRPGGTFLGYDLVRTPLASVFHRLDGSPHRLIMPRDFRAECARNGLTISLQSRLLAHVMRFVACKDTANAGDTAPRYANQWWEPNVIGRRVASCSSTCRSTSTASPNNSSITDR
jgi:SAM-dependent methyltransferase